MAAPPPSTSTITESPYTHSAQSQTQPQSQPQPHPHPPNPRTLRIGTRSSALALAQCTLFTTLLPPTTHGGPLTTIIPTTTSLGDTDKSTDLHTLASGGKALWTEDLEQELLQGRVDVLVHSMKDVPTQIAREFRVVAVGGREEARDAVVMSATRTKEGMRTLRGLPDGAVVGTSSVRRAAMIRRMYPHLRIQDVRGNVGTRLDKLDNPEMGFDALVLAGAGVQRIGLGGRVSSWLGKEEGVLHAVGQGALGVEWRAGDEWVEGLIGGLGKGREAKRVRWECVAERGVLRALEGGCSVPVGVACSWQDSSPDAPPSLTPLPAPSPTPNPSHPSASGLLNLHGMVVSLDGQECIQGSQRHYVSSDAEAEECAMKLYRELVEKGAEKILKEITLNRGMIRGLGGA
ncbi:hypothetical protein N7G274_000241 [Stereocaulon virgatum]|uniref:hydroxymethylbilane synthase n=1 Tax=Stereocaulon virgatum TaxID=373712 RepID=A0ABR4ASW3_9LECA